MNETAKANWFQAIADSIRREPLAALLIATIIATFVYFFGALPLFIRGTFISGACSVFAWAWQAWNPGANQEHSKLVPLIFLGLLFYDRREIASADKSGDKRGLFFVAI